MATLRLGRIAAVFIGAFVVLSAVAAGVLWVTLSRDPVPMHVRWKPGTSDAERLALERRFGLTQGEVTEGTTRAYRLADTTTDNIRAMVQHPSVEDTSEINRIRYRPSFAHDRQRRLLFFSVVSGALGAVALLLVPSARSRFKLKEANV